MNISLERQLALYKAARKHYSMPWWVVIFGSTFDYKIKHQLTGGLCLYFNAKHGIELKDLTVLIDVAREIVTDTACNYHWFTPGQLAPRKRLLEAAIKETKRRLDSYNKE